MRLLTIARRILRCPRRTESDDFRVTIHDSAVEFRLAVEGTVTASGASEVEQCWRTAASTIGRRQFVLDLNRAGSIRREAIGALGRLYREGATLAGAGPEHARLIAAIAGHDTLDRLPAEPASSPGLFDCLARELQNSRTACLRARLCKRALNA